MSAVSQDVEALLAGLEVESIDELRRLVTYGRGLVVTVNQRVAIEAMHPGQDVLVRGAERHGYFEGALHVQKADPDADWLNAGIIAADVTKEHGNLGISYETLMSMPPGRPE